ncbi:hypothetical protein Q1695_003381 [Nippostrongylus brasiliensis]|nr:hypothetical protein Q1695_003381 [Nippostrongylus brasiliensis]
MSKAGAVGRGLYAVLAFVVNALLRIGVNISLVAAVAVTVYAAVSFSREALKERKEAINSDVLEGVFVGHFATSDNPPTLIVSCEKRTELQMRRGSMQTECYGGEKVNARQGKDARRKPRLCGNLENTGGKGVDVIGWRWRRSNGRRRRRALFEPVVSLSTLPTLPLTAPTATVRFLQSAPMAQPKFKKSAQKIHYEPAKDFPGKVLELLYWRDPKKSAVALSLILLAVFILGKYPILSVLAYSGLAVLAGTVGFRIYKTIESQVKKTSGENPFQEYLTKDVQLPQERIHAQVDVLAEHATLLVNQLKRLVFVENIVDSVKFALILWALTYIGCWFSGFALVVLAVLGAFSVPKVYEMYKEPIDAQLAVISEHISKISKMAEEKLPFLKKAAVEVEKKDQ